MTIKFTLKSAVRKDGKQALLLRITKGREFTKWVNTHLNIDIKRKIALFCNVRKEAVIESIDAETIYEVPLLMKKEELDKVVLSRLSMPLGPEPDFMFNISYSIKYRMKFSGITEVL